MNAVRSRARRFMEVLVKTKASSSGELETYRSYFNRMRLTEEGNDAIHYREEFFEGTNGVEGHGNLMERSAITLYKEFIKNIEEASARKIISAESKRKWTERFESTSVGFKAKEYWVLHQMPHYMAAWQQASDDRKELLRHPEFKNLLQYDSRFATIENEGAFLTLHHERRRGLLAEARAALRAGNREQLDLYAAARTKLEQAASRKVLSHNKIGGWLERIFKKKASPKRIVEFLEGSGTNSLPALIRNWTRVRERYDKVRALFQAQGDEQLPRGIHLVTEHQFLGMHYEQRLHYTEEMERRLAHGPDISLEHPSFIKIRHAIDLKDWEDAAILIEQARLQPLSEKDASRLDSMRRYVRQFARGTDAAASGIADALHAKNRIDELAHQVPSCMQPMILRLLRGPHANRSIFQLRWIVYNNKWCRDRGYLNFERAQKGASAENREITKLRSEHGEDVGRNDVLDHETSDGMYFRKKEYAVHKATYLHVNAKSTDAMETVAKKMEHEQDSKWLYWSTLCMHEDGVPMSDNWHNDLLATLTEMRSLTRTIDRADCMYAGPNNPLRSKHSSHSLSMAA